MEIKALDKVHVRGWEALRRALYGEISEEAMRQDFVQLIESPDERCILVFDDREQLTGFAEMALRKYVDDCDTSPVAYLEGIYIQPQSRGMGAGRLLLDAAETWAKGRGCTEFATDSRLADLSAHRFHRHFGFEETGRIVQFKKLLAEKGRAAGKF